MKHEKSDFLIHDAAFDGVDQAEIADIDENGRPSDGSDSSSLMRRPLKKGGPVGGSGNLFSQPLI